MQATSPLYNKIIKKTNHWFETKVVVDGTEYLENQLYSVSTSIQAFQNNPEIGKAVSQEVFCEIINPGRDFPQMAKIEVFVRVSGVLAEGTTASFSGDTVIFTGYSSFSGDTVVFSAGADVSVGENTLKISNEDGEGSSEWLPQGVFYIDTKEFSRNYGGIVKCSLHGYDAMLKGEADYDSTDLDWPALDVDVLEEIAGKMEVEIDPRTYDIMTDGYTLPLPTNYSLREVLEIIAAKYLGVFVITDVGKLLLVSIVGLPEDIGLLIDESGDYITFGGVRIIINGQPSESVEQG